MLSYTMLDAYLLSHAVLYVQRHAVLCHAVPLYAVLSCDS